MLITYIFWYNQSIQDPSVQQAAGNNAARAQQGLEEYNPFDGSQTAKFPVVCYLNETSGVDFFLSFSLFSQKMETRHPIHLLLFRLLL